MSQTQQDTYRSRDGKHYFMFNFTPTADEVEVHCNRHPSLNGRDPDPRRTHIFSSRKLCFVSGRAPTTIGRARELARQWAEYLLEYIRTGEAQN
jgi:hypothetical protein